MFSYYCHFIISFCFVLQRINKFIKQIYHIAVQHYQSLYQMVVWTMWIIQRFQLNVPQSHKHNICRLKMISSLTTGHHQSDCQYLLSEVSASSWYSYTSPYLSFQGMIWKLNLSLYKLRKEITIISKILRFCCAWNLTFFNSKWLPNVHFALYGPISQWFANCNTCLQLYKTVCMHFDRICWFWHNTMKCTNKSSRDRRVCFVVT